MKSVPRNPKILRIFISYAHEDEVIARAVSNALQEALGDTLAEVFIDKMSLEAGFEFKTQIEDRLDNTDIFIIIYTGVEKPSHGFTGWEVGYFRGVQRRGNSGLEIERRIVPVYLNEPPATVSGVQGIALGITRETLSMAEADFISGLTVPDDDAMVKFLDELKEIVEKIREQSGYAKELVPT